MVLTTPDQFVESDADRSRDVYRVDAETGELIRVSTNVVGTAGNGPLDAGIGGSNEHHPTTAISDDGQKIVFTTYEALSPLDGNEEPDVYLWTPSRRLPHFHRLRRLRPQRNRDRRIFDPQRGH